MLTTHPSIMLGSYLWDEDRVPRDEFDIRLAPLRDAMASNGWVAVLVYGDAREHQALAYFTNFIPRMRWALALMPAQGEPLSSLAGLRLITCLIDSDHVICHSHDVGNLRGWRRKKSE